MKGAKLYKVEVWHYADGPDDSPEDHWDEPPVSVTTIPDCESFELDFAWEGDLPQSSGIYPDNLVIYGSIKTYDHRAAYFLAGRYPIEDYMIIGDCLLLYYQTDDGELWRYRLNGVYFAATRTMRMYFTEEVDTGKSEHSQLTWVLAEFHHDWTGIFSNFELRVIHEWWNGDAWVAAAELGP